MNKINSKQIPYTTGLPYTNLKNKNYTKTSTKVKWWTENKYEYKSPCDFLWNNKKKLYPNECIRTDSKNKLKIELDKWQHRLLIIWHHISIDIYNLANKYIKENSLYKNEKGYYQNISEIKIRDIILGTKKTTSILNSELRNRINKRKYPITLQRSIIKDLVGSYSSCVSNFINGNIKKFNVKNMDHFQTKSGFWIDKTHVNKGNILFAKSININLPIDTNIEKDFKITYNISSRIITVNLLHSRQIEPHVPKEEICGVDLGIRKYATIYSPKSSIEIDSSLLRKNIKEYNSVNITNPRKQRKKKRRLANKIKNRKKDLQDHLAKKLITGYKTIMLGDIESSKVKTSKITKSVKNEFDWFGFYQFKVKLQNKQEEYGNKIYLINEAYTSQSCGKCSSFYKTSDEVHTCQKCKIITDRDHNGARNIMMKGIYENRK
jgi:IS605 OrfB family transposase